LIIRQRQKIKRSRMQGGKEGKSRKRPFSFVLRTNIPSCLALSPAPWAGGKGENFNNFKRKKFDNGGLSRRSSRAYVNELGIKEGRVLTTFGAARGPACCERRGRERKYYPRLGERRFSV
jgi:hypothetical protein